MMLMRRLSQAFFEWYERNYALNVGIAAVLFLLQIAHLYWLSAHVVALRLVGESYFTPGGAFEYAILIIDYTEIPALISVSLVYINEMRRTGGWSWKPLIFLLFLNSQWLHIFWITDEFVVNEFQGQATVGALPVWLAWVAIVIDYLELPVIVDTLRKFAVSIRQQRLGELLREDLPSGDQAVAGWTERPSLFSSSRPPATLSRNDSARRTE